MDLDLIILTPERKHHLPRLRQLVFQSPQGEAGVLPGHAPLLSLVDTGVVRAFAAGRDPNAHPLSFVVAQGSLRAIDDHIVLLTQRADRENELDIDMIRAELDHAEIRATSLDPIDEAEALEEAIQTTRYCEAVFALDREISTRHPDLTTSH